ncbi:MAG: uroporphyrinogen decarboxylase family protein [Anaerolineae bacterium]|nr:hypothetical protein [Thermoflexales bacterium]MDW8407583.1 uroporphyrinogen decarboxylase family protein [Anaerolineae bacterium]
MSEMTKLERFNAAVRGGEVDRLPVCMWVHFASEHYSGEETARLHVNFFKTYDWDFMKTMNDYRLPLPGGVNVTRPEQLLAFKPLSMDHPTYANQLACLRRIRAELGPDVAVLDTLFDPLQTLVRGTGRHVRELVFENPEAGHAALEAITCTLIAYIAELRALGVNGIFYSINGAVDPAKGGFTDAQYAEFVDPYNRRILHAAEGMTRIAHVHGFNLRFERCLSYPVEVFSWSHLATPPSLAQARQMTPAALLGGIDETQIAYQSVDDVRTDIVRSIEEAGPRKLLIGPGCTVPPDTPYRLLKAAGDTVRSLRFA